MRERSLIICGFPGIGKTFLSKLCDIVDSDSSKFKSDHKGYIKHLRKLYDQGQVVLSSTHEDVIRGLLDLDLNILLVYPDISLKPEYFKRYVDRGSDGPFISLLMDNWDSWIKTLSDYECPQVILKSNEHLNDVVDRSGSMAARCPQCSELLEENV